MKKITKNIHHSVYIDENVLIGKNTKIWHFSHISQNVKIGKNCSLGQNIFVELFLYYDQLGEGKNLSWAPLIPTGNIFNPVLFEFNGRSVSFQTQLPWLILPPILYLAVIRLGKKLNRLH